MLACHCCLPHPIRTQPALPSVQHWSLSVPLDPLPTALCLSPAFSSVVQASFQVFGMELLCQLDTTATADFFTTFFRLPATFWRGFLASKLSSSGCEARRGVGVRAAQLQL